MYTIVNDRFFFLNWLPSPNDDDRYCLLVQVGGNFFLNNIKSMREPGLNPKISSRKNVSSSHRQCNMHQLFLLYVAKSIKMLYLIGTHGLVNWHNANF